METYHDTVSCCEEYKNFAYAHRFPVFLFTKHCKSDVKNQIKNHELLEARQYLSEFSLGLFNVNEVIGGGCLLPAGGKVVL